MVKGVVVVLFVSQKIILNMLGRASSHGWLILHWLCSSLWNYFISISKIVTLLVGKPLMFLTLCAFIDRIVVVVNETWIIFEIG